MKIIRLSLENFRQFYDKHTLEFGSNEGNVTIVLGANGNGKTGIFRAVMFALYGDISLEQDGNTKNLYLVNLDKMDENPGMPIEAAVTLDFEYNHEIYSIIRKITSIKTGAKVESQVSHAEIYRIGKHGDYIRETIDPDVFVNSVLDKSIREFFFFDAEKMELLNTTKSSKKMSEEIKNGLVKLLQIKSLDTAGTLFKELASRKKREIVQLAKDEKLRGLQDQKEENETKRETLEAETGVKKQERIRIQNLIENIEDKLSSNEQIRALQKVKERVEQDFLKEQTIYNEQKNTVKGQLGNSFNFMALDILEKNEKRYDELLSKQADTIPVDLIRHSLNDGACQLCRTRFEENSIQESILIKLLENYTFSDTTPTFQAIKRSLNLLRANKKITISKMNEYIQKIVSTEENMEEQERQLDIIKDQIKEKASLLENLKELEKQLTIHKEKKEKLDNEIQMGELKLDNIEDDLIKLSKKIDQLAAEQEGIDLEISTHDILENMQEIVSRITTEYTTEVIDVLSQEMTATFKALLSQKDKSLFEKVVINTDYEISLLDKRGVNRIQDLSMGQGQIFTLAFITTLAKLASRGRQEIEFPLFMDTPFARLSGENRDNLISNIPFLANQWILLLTDTELTKVEQRAFDQNGKVGKVYELENIDGRTAVIEKSDIREFEVSR